jgi:hypothetical protein
MVKKVGRRTVNYDKIHKEGLERKIREKLSKKDRMWKRNVKEKYIEQDGMLFTRQNRCTKKKRNETENESRVS